METIPDTAKNNLPTKSTGSLGWAKLLIVLVPLLFLVGYYSYDEVRAAITRVYSGAAAVPSLATTTIGLTITPDNLQSGLIGHWTFDGPEMNWSSTTAEVLDSSGNNKHGNIINFTSSAATLGKIGQSLRFDGQISSGDDYVDFGSFGEFDNLSTMSISAWVKRSGSGENGYAVILSKSSGNTPTTGWEFIAGSLLYFRAGGTALTYRYTNTVPLNQWSHVVVTWVRGTSALGIKFFVNGQATTGDTLNNGFELASDDINKLVVGNTVSANRTFEGMIDDVRLYNRIISDDEITQLYTLGVGSTIKICEEASVQDADSNTYNTLAIGSQCWLDRNMNVGTRISVATAQTNNSTLEKWCYSNSDANCTTNNPNKPDGGLYQWNEAMQYSTTPGARGICPVGFHIPTDQELHTLEKFLLDGGATCSATRVGYGCAPSGTKLKPGGRSLFEWNLAGYGVSGFFYNRASYGYLWSSSESGGSAWVRIVLSGDAQVFRNAGGKTVGCSVRCLQD